MKLNTDKGRIQALSAVVISYFALILPSPNPLMVNEIRYFNLALILGGAVGFFLMKLVVEAFIWINKRILKEYKVVEEDLLDSFLYPLVILDLAILVFVAAINYYQIRMESLPLSDASIPAIRNNAEIFLGNTLSIIYYVLVVVIAIITIRLILKQISSKISLKKAILSTSISMLIFLYLFDVVILFVSTTNFIWLFLGGLLI